MRPGFLVVCGLVLSVLLVGCTSAAEHGAEIRNTGASQVIPGQYLVRLKDAAVREHADVAAVASAVAARTGASLRHVYSAQLRAFSVTATEAQARDLAAQPEVEFVEQDHYVHAATVQTDPPNWGLDRIDQRDLPLNGVYIAPNSNVHAYVIDSGIRITHNTFGGRASYGINTVDGNTDADDCSGHGTFVAGILGGSHYGVAKDAQIVAIKVLGCDGNGTGEQIAEGIDWVTQHAQRPAVANVSLGLFAAESDAGLVTQAINDAIDSGITVAMSAGNEGIDACEKMPKNVPDAITVGATDRSDRRWATSNYGSCVSLFAPGVDITSASNTSDRDPATDSGTSAAAPHVAGAAALVLAEHPTFTPRQVKDALIGVATLGKIPNPGTGSFNRLLYVENRPGDGGGSPAGDLDEMFRVYGDQGGHWTGGDEAVSVPLPDGRTAWLFSDSFLGQVNPDGSRPANTPMIHNCIVVQDGTTLTATLTGGTPTSPRSLVGSETDSDPSDAGWWVDDGLVENNQLLVFYTHYKHTGAGGPLDIVQVGTALAAFSLPTLTLASLTPISRSSTIKWGTALTDDADYTYIYGVEAADGNKYLHVARVANTQPLTANWEYRTDGGWSANESDSMRVMSGVGDGMSVDEIGDEYVLITQDTGQVFNPGIVAYRAATPTGPFTGETYLYRAPDVAGNVIAYDARMHPEFNSGGKITVGYSVNSLDPAEVHADVQLYRPRFVDVTLPPAPDPTALPPTPTDLTAAASDSGVDLSWLSSQAGLSYYIYQRDASAGQSQFTRLTYPTTDTRFSVGFLTNGHTYEFKVSSLDSVGESPLSLPASAVPAVAAPGDAPGNLTATPQADGTIALAWNAVSEPGVFYWVYQRDDTAGETDFQRWGLPIEGTTATATFLGQDHQYDFKVAATNQGGIGPDSNVATATAHTEPPGAPTALSATAQADGSIRLDWTTPGGNVWFRVYQRDITAGDADFTEWEWPVTTCCTITAGYLTNAHTYEFKVTATNAGGEGPASNLAQATAVFTAPQAPSNLRGTPGDGQVTLTWDPPPGGDVWYWAYYRDVTAGETAFTQSKYPISGGTTLTLSFLINGDVYEFKITAISQGGESGPSNLLRLTPMPVLPGKPTGLTATPQTDGSITLAWTPPGPDVYTWIYVRDVTAGETTFTKGQYPVDKNTVNMGLLINAHTYEFKVAATNLAGDGPPSDPVQAVCRYAPPPAPTNLRGVSAGDGSIDLTWDAPAPNLYYWIYFRDVTAGQTAFTRGQYPTDKTALTMGLLASNHVYEFKVSAANQGGEGPAGSPIQVTSHGGLPNPPSGLSASAGDGHVLLRWTASTTASVYYWVYRRDVTAGESWHKMPSPVNATSLDVTFLVNGDTYEFKVTATNSIGDSAASNVVSARPMPPLPGAPSNLTAAAGNGQVTLNWSASPTANVYYWVYLRDTTAGSAWKKLPVPVNGRSLDVQYLSNGHLYEFKVSATNLAGDSPTSNVASARPMPPFPQAPSSLTASPGDGKAVLHWSASPTADVWYLIEYRDATLGQSWRRLPYPDSTCCSFTVTYLSNGHTYDFRVRATNLAGDSSPSSTDSARPMPPVPAAPSGLTATGGANSVALSWHASSTPNVYYWVYYRDVTAGESYHHLPYPVNATSLDVQYLSHGDTYSFYVTATNLAGDSGRSNVVTVTLAPPDGTSGYATVTSAYRGTVDADDNFSYLQQDYVTGTVHGYRSGDTMRMVLQWDTHGHHLYEGIFWYLLIDCTEGYTIWHTTLGYPHGTGSTSGTTTYWPTIDPGHYYAVRVWGSGQVQDTGQLLSQFSPKAPPRIRDFDATSKECF